VSWPQRITTASWLRVVAFGLFGVAPACVVPTALLGVDLADVLGLDHQFDIPIACLGLLEILACTIGAARLLTLRDPGPASISHDEYGFTEWRGASVRTSIPWSEAIVCVVDRRTRSRGEGYRSGVELSITSRRGWSIYTTWGARESLFGGPPLPHFARRRRVFSQVEFEPSTFHGVSFERADSIVVDPRDERRRFLVGSRIIGAAFLACFAGGFAMLGQIGSYDHQIVGGPLFGLAGIFMLLRCIRPLRETRTLEAEAARCASSRPFALSGESRGEVALATGADGESVEIDLSSAPHPDAALASRRTRVHAVVEGGGGGGPYREGGPLVAIAVETDFDRDERARILRANRIEMLGRVVVAVLLSVLGYVFATGRQVH
jgi:hypothetical protein